MTAVGGKQALYVPLDVLTEWHAHARAGQRTIYVRGVPAPDHAVMQLVREWIACGEATSSQGRDPANKEPIYYVTRCRPQALEGAAQRASIPDAWRETPDGRMFVELVRAANLGLPCPSNAALADLLGLRDADAARYVLRRLVNAARIEVDLSGPGRAHRRVRIIETGRWTAAQTGGEA
ncbi:UNVERIFIED_ORG: hypothetical protein M2348_001087 [Sphingomonas sp. R1F5B]